MTHPRDTLTGTIAEMVDGRVPAGEVHRIRDHNLLWIAEDSVIDLHEVVGLSIGTDSRSQDVLQLRLRGGRTITLDYAVDARLRLPLFDAISANIFAGEPLVTLLLPAPGPVGESLPLVQPPVPDAMVETETAEPPVEQDAHRDHETGADPLAVLEEKFLRPDDEVAEPDPEPDPEPAPHQTIIFDEAETVELPVQEDADDERDLLDDLIGDEAVPDIPEPFAPTHAPEDADADYAIPAPAGPPVSEPDEDSANAVPPAPERPKEFDPDNQSLEDWLSGLPTPNQEKLSVSHNVRLEKKPLLPYED
ncbi:hypothetical protein F8O07_07040 [Pseudoclavibacter sp. CFCC 13796]|uniref:hypothetical protein n=1 Tax=Pseudoclavibacter sp. CFCC 13796 TaxID=2615179 RepID=UPI0013018CF9|nr:hypothetical protein [Pseudoclavibacter sp. CFCC 13796]KAB1661655.1 hypothetical protein F8O07_07040 [Pseudoclavibacter sp. CFCC 13796]